ncbi:uncharacterized protein PAC_17611 [Phialocephala subalpina]|uniref:FAD-binding domain-containing protein n=1 Tax=Phialocephala subalpina TaxID=576137 RepID=A0A1L7XRN2_9HELO|nr:uncharacterized protein PAC_17611 [Phialocephala subalpina]
MGSQASPLRVLIIGSGSAGLLFGQVLKQAGIACTVFEQDTSFYQRPRDWNFGIYWAQSRLDECLTDDLKPLVKTVQTDPSYVAHEGSVMPVHNGETGELMKNLPAPWSLRLKRKKWLEMIQKDVDIKWGKRLKSIETGANNTVTATFEDGSKETGNLLVGCEGAHSLTREYLFGPKEAALLPSPCVASVTITKLSRQASIDLRALHPRYTITFHPNGMFTWMSIHDCTSKDPGDWTWMLMQTWRSDEPTGLEGDNILPAMYEAGKDFGYPFNEVFATIPSNTKVWHNRLSYWPTKPWDGKGLVTLAGDAAHAMTFHRGQGLNNAISDAADFLVHLRAMKEQTPEELIAAVKKYEAELVPRGNEAVMASYMNTNAVHDWNTMMQSPLFTEGMAKDKKAEEDAAAAKLEEEKAAEATRAFAAATLEP